MFQVFKLFTVAMFILSSKSVWSQANIEGQTQKKSKTLIRHSLGADVRVGANQTPGESAASTAGLDYTAVMVPTQNISMIFRTGFTNEISGLEREANLNNSLLITNFNNIWSNEFGRLNINTFTTLPTNPDSWEFESFRGGIQAGPNWVFKTPAHIFLRVRTNISKRFHEFKTRINGARNAEYVLGHQLMFSYAFNSTFSFTNIFTNNHVWTYGGARSQDIFYMGQILDINLNRNMTISLGHDLQDQTFSYNGKTYNLAVYDTDQSMFYTYLTYRF